MLNFPANYIRDTPCPTAEACKHLTRLVDDQAILRLHAVSVYMF